MFIIYFRGLIAENFEKDYRICLYLEMTSYLVEEKNKDGAGIFKIHNLTNDENFTFKVRLIWLSVHESCLDICTSGS